MDQPVVERAKARGIDTKPLGDGRSEALDRDVGGSRNLVHEFASLVGFHVDRYAALVTIGTQDHRAKAGRRKRRPSPRLIALPHRLNLDDLGAEIAEILRAEGARENFRKIENLDAIERS